MSKFDSLIAEPAERVEKILLECLQGSELENCVNTMCLQIVRSGGKRLRPKLTLLSGLALVPDDTEALSRFEQMGAAIELLHTATLIHDDVIDKSPLRRGKKTLNETEGNHIAVLAGDYMFTRCFLIAYKLDSRVLFKAVNHTIAALIAGEINQLERQNDLQLTPESYRQTIYWKTGALFELAASGPAVFHNQSEEIIEALKTYGRELGIGFQITDDILDYTSDAGKLGKNSGEDLADGRITLPLILALRQAPPSVRAQIEEAVRHADLTRIHGFIRQYSTLEQCRASALEAAQKAREALQVLPPSPYRDGLAELADFAVTRTS